MAMVVQLYEMKRITSGTASALVGVKRVEFLLDLHRYGVAAIDLSTDELQADFDIS